MQKNSLIITIVVVAVLVVIGIIAGIALTAKGGNENNNGTGIQVVDSGSQQAGSSGSGSELGSSLLGQGETYSYTFSTPGIFNYHCAPHPYMKGKIIVE